MSFALGVVDWLAIAAGAAAVAWIYWYFFRAERAAATALSSGGGVQEVTIAVHGGYDPATVRVRAGSPVRLVFDRQETSSCSEELVFPDFGIRTFLPAHRKTPIEVTPTKAGVYEFTCGMSMLRGKLIAE
jgi:plastocyanin domain-containing protein